MLGLTVIVFIGTRHSCHNLWYGIRRNKALPENGPSINSTRNDQAAAMVQFFQRFPDNLFMGLFATRNSLPRFLTAVIFGVSTKTTRADSHYPHSRLPQL